MRYVQAYKWIYYMFNVSQMCDIHILDPNSWKHSKHDRSVKIIIDEEIKKISFFPLNIDNTYRNKKIL